MRTDTERLNWLDDQTFLVEARDDMPASARVELNHHMVHGGGLVGSYSSFGANLRQAIDAAMDAEEQADE